MTDSADTPPKRKIADARELAGELLARTRSTGPFIADLFDSLAEQANLDARDRHLALELAAGVVRHRRTLDRVLEGFSRRPMVKSPPPLRLLVRLGAYQLLFLDRIPDHAAVDQTVELAKKWARPRLKRHPASIASFVNGLLRAVAAGRQVVPFASVGSQTPAPDQPAGLPSSTVSYRRLIERPGSENVAVIDRDVLADPKQSPGEFLADAYSFEPWLADRWVQRFGLDKARQIARAQNRRPRMVIRVNTLRTTPEAVIEMLAGEGVQAAPVRPGLPLLRVLDGDPLAGKAMMQGLIQPQDPWAASIVPKLSLRAGMTVLDRCAAPGTKTTQMVEIMQNKGVVLAVGQDDEDLERIMTSTRRLGGHIVRTVLADQVPAELIKIEKIDAALVDAPCSNSGVLARRPEARWRMSAESLARLAGEQRDLLMDAINWVAPGGKILYATCSIEPEENDQVVRYAVGRRHGQVRLVDEKLTLPSESDDHDGGYWALLDRVR
jgi:16S rRNA (cytosine967-C5)-methyltransferase